MTTGLKIDYTNEQSQGHPVRTAFSKLAVIDSAVNRTISDGEKLS
jgi:hypothetical protein